MSSEDSSNDWKNKFNDLVNTCQSELKKTTKIGMKMISASQSNSFLQNRYEKIGRWLVEQYDAGKIQVEDKEVLEWIAKAKELTSQLDDFEQEVRDIKKESGSQ